MYGYNAELYTNSSEARHKSQGLVAISVMIQVILIGICFSNQTVKFIELKKKIGDTPNQDLRSLSTLFSQVIFRGVQKYLILLQFTVNVKLM